MDEWTIQTQSQRMIKLSLKLRRGLIAVSNKATSAKLIVANTTFILDNVALKNPQKNRFLPANIIQQNRGHFYYFTFILASSVSILS